MLPLFPTDTMLTGAYYLHEIEFPLDSTEELWCLCCTSLTYRFVEKHFAQSSIQQNQLLTLKTVKAKKHCGDHILQIKFGDQVCVCFPILKSDNVCCFYLYPTFVSKGDLEQYITLPPPSTLFEQQQPYKVG